MSRASVHPSPNNDRNATPTLLPALAKIKTGRSRMRPSLHVNARNLGSSANLRNGPIPLVNLLK